MPSDFPELLTVAEVAALLHSTPGAVYNAIERRQIPPECVVHPFGTRTIRLRGDRLGEHIERRTEPPARPQPYVLPEQRRKRRRA